MNHPLLNPDSKHYAKDGKQSILTIEETLNMNEMIGACTFNIMKYTLRLESKGQKESDLKKIQTYQDYRDLLVGLRQEHSCGHMIVKSAYRFCGLEISYEKDKK